MHYFHDVESYRCSDNAANLEGNGPDGLRQAHHDLPELGVWGGCKQKLLQAVANLYKM